MSKKALKAELPEALCDFLGDVKGAVGNSYVGSIIYGSIVTGAYTETSDIDVAVIVADLHGEPCRQQIFRTLAASSVDQTMVSLSVETYLRFKEYLHKGDPFAWVVCHGGAIHDERDNLLSGLQQQCRTLLDVPESQLVSDYLRSKSSNHYAQAMQAFHQCLSHLQLSVMAGAQACVSKQQGHALNKDNLIDLSKWTKLKQGLQQMGASRREVESAEQLIMAYKQVRKDSDHVIGHDILEKIQTMGNLWHRLLDE